jgi:hypothetical protein
MSVLPTTTMDTVLHCEDLLGHMLCFLPTEDKACHVPLVCKAWHRACQQPSTWAGTLILKHLNKMLDHAADVADEADRQYRLDRLAKLLARVKHVSSGDSDVRYVARLPGGHALTHRVLNFLARLPGPLQVEPTMPDRAQVPANFSQVTWSYCDISGSRPAEEENAEHPHVQCLTSIESRGIYWHKAEKWYPNVTKVNIIPDDINFSWPSDEFLLKLTSLRVPSIDFRPRLFPSIEEKEEPLLPQLEELIVHSHLDITSDQLSLVLRHLPNLKHLSLPQHHSVGVPVRDTTRALMEACGALNRLEKLHISGKAADPFFDMPLLPRWRSFTMCGAIFSTVFTHDAPANWPAVMKWNTALHRRGPTVLPPDQLPNAVKSLKLDYRPMHPDQKPQEIPEYGGRLSTLLCLAEHVQYMLPNTNSVGRDLARLHLLVGFRNKPYLPAVVEQLNDCAFAGRLYLELDTKDQSILPLLELKDKFKSVTIICSDSTHPADLDHVTAERPHFFF